MYEYDDHDRFYIKEYKPNPLPTTKIGFCWRFLWANIETVLCFWWEEFWLLCCPCDSYRPSIDEYNACCLQPWIRLWFCIWFVIEKPYCLYCNCCDSCIDDCCKKVSCFSVFITLAIVVISFIVAIIYMSVVSRTEVTALTIPVIIVISPVIFLVFRIYLRWSYNYWCIPCCGKREFVRKCVNRCLWFFNKPNIYRKNGGPLGWESKELNISQQSYKDVEKAFRETFNIYKDRMGRDAQNLNHVDVKVETIYEIINEKLHYDYKYERQELQKKAKKLPDKRINKIEENENRCQGKLLMQGRTIDGHLCDDMINEVFLFHGTKKENIDSIAKDGFRLDKAQPGLFGKAIYLAESSEKSDQYADFANARRDHGLTMLMVKTLLGRTYIHSRGGGIAMPCYVKGCFTPGCKEHQDKLCDSIVAQLNDLKFREVIIQDTKKVMLKFVIKYKRIYDN